MVSRGVSSTNASTLMADIRNGKSSASCCTRCSREEALQSEAANGTWAMFTRSDATATPGDQQPLVNNKQSSGGGQTWQDVGLYGHVTVPVPGMYEICLTADVEPWTGDVTFELAGYPQDLGKSTVGEITHIVHPVGGVVAKSIHLRGVADLKEGNLTFRPLVVATNRTVLTDWTLTRACSLFMRKLPS